MTNKPARSTTEKLIELKTGSFSKLRRRYGISVSKATLSRIARGVGPVSLETENGVRVALGLEPIIPTTATAPVCPHCGIVHVVGDCGGVDGEPVIVPNGARIVRKRQPRPQPPAWVTEAADNLESLRQPWPGSRAWWQQRKVKISK